MTEHLDMCDMEDKYGRRERMDSAITPVLSHLKYPVNLLIGYVAMGFRYESVEACEAYDTLGSWRTRIDQDKWDVTKYGPVTIGPGVYEVIVATRK